MRKFWLLKSEPDCYSVDQLKRDGATLWTGVRNYQARNFLQSMAKGDLALFYHSSVEPPAVVGVAEVSKEAVPDPEQFLKDNEYYDPKATPDSPRWFCPEVRFKKKFREPVPLPVLRHEKQLAKMVLLQKGSRLSVQPVTKEEFDWIVELAER